MHKLLARQLRAAHRADGSLDVDILLAIIDKAYAEFDTERRLNDRAASLMEDELTAANEEAQREHDAVLATILGSAPDGMLVTASDSTIETANRAAELQFGAAAGNLVGRGMSELLAIGPGAENDSGDQDPGNRHARETTGRRLDGTQFPAEFSVSQLRTGHIVHRLWIVRDISERIQTQRQVVESRMRFRDFAEASSDCFWEMNRELSAVDATAAGDTATVDRLVRVLTPNSLGDRPVGVDEEVWTRLRTLLSAREPFRDLRLAMSGSDGNRVHISLSGKPIFDLNGEFSGYRGTARDLTREVTAREAARRAERRTNDAMNAAPSAIALVEASLNFVAGNSALTTLLAADDEQLHPGSPFPQFFERALTKDGTLDDGRTPVEFLRDLIATERPREIRIGENWLLAAGRRLSDQGAVLTFSDVTALKERERELAEAKKTAESANHLKSQFLATMSHELRTPLNAILGFSEVIRDQVFGRGDRAWSKYVEYSSSIYASGRHLLSLISEILDLSKIEAGNYVLDIERVDMSALVREAVTILEPAAKSGGVRLRHNLPPSPVALMGDTRALRQIALNLLSNAVKFTPLNGKVDVTLQFENGMAILVVEDTGIGIAPHDQVSVFEPFRQVDASVRRRHEGTGLGLAITRRLVEMHGGTIGLASELGVGTRLEIRIPAVRAQSNSGTIAEAAA